MFPIREPRLVPTPSTTLFNSPSPVPAPDSVPFVRDPFAASVVPARLDADRSAPLASKKSLRLRRIWTEGYRANCSAHGFEILTEVVETFQEGEGVTMMRARSVVRASMVRGWEEERCCLESAMHELRGNSRIRGT